MPYAIHTVLTDNGTLFCDLPSRRNGPTARLRLHMFDGVCSGTAPSPIILDQRSGRKDEPDHQGPTVNRFHYDSHDQLRRHLQDLIDAYNFGRRLKTLKGLTPYELICKQCRD